MLPPKSRRVLAVAFAVLTAGIVAAGLAPVRAATPDAELLNQAQGAFDQLPKDMATAEFPVTPARVALGRDLFFDTRLSVDGTTSCSRCHLSQLYGTDGLMKSHGNHDKVNSRNAPTVLNAALQVSAHWTGDRKSVEEQAMRSLRGPPSMGNPDADAAMARIKAVPTYIAMFQKAFPDEADPVVEENAAKAIGAYERTLVTPSRFDTYLGGKIDALSTRERAGLRKFIATGCASCHYGAGVGGATYRKFGVYADYWTETQSKDIDKGRVDFTKNEADTYVFKVPSLRNVVMTPPYFHDGSVGALPEAVRIMAKVQLDKTLSAEDTGDIVAFLGSLTGKLPKNFATAPELPPGGFVPAN
jgi:cytochrome c peroxidase